MAKDKSTRFYILFAVAALACIGAVVALLRRPNAGPAAAPSVVTEEQSAYLTEIIVSNARMSAAENFLGNTVIYLDAHLTNRGAKTVRRLELQLEFLDFYGQVVLRERAAPVTPRAPPLKPGEARAIQISFENVPASWSQAPPRITPTRVEF